MDHNTLRDLCNWGKEFIADVGRSGTYNVLTPNYAASSEATRYSAIPLFVDTSSSTYAEPRISGAEYFSIFGPADITPGDVIIKSPASPSSAPITVITADSRHKECVGIRTDRVGQLYRTKRDSSAIYTSVRFGYLIGDVSQPGLEPSMGSQHYENHRIVLWGRASFETDMRFKDVGSGQWFTIAQVDRTQTYFLARLEEES